MKILVVDDSSEMRRLLKNIIAEIADEIYECSDGAEAIDLYREHRPDWVLMDVFMKQTDGIATTLAIKQINNWARIIFVTNHTDKRTRQAAMDAGAEAFFGKDGLMNLLPFLKS